MLLCFLLAAVLTGLDQAVKAWTVGHFTAPAASFTATADPAQPLLPGIVELTRVHNYGAAWSNFSGMRWFLSAVTAAVLLAVLALLLRGRVRHPLGRIAGALISDRGDLPALLEVAVPECLLSLVWMPFIYLLFRAVYRKVGGDKLA